MRCFNKSRSTEQYLTVCVCLSHCHLVIPEERLGDSSGCRHCRKPRKALLLLWVVKATSDRWPCQRLCSTRVAHPRVNLHSRRKPGMNHEVNRWDPAAFFMCCRDQGGGHFQPCKFLVAKFSLEMSVSTFGRALQWAPSPWQWECCRPQAEGAMDALLPRPAVFLSCTAEPCRSWLCSCRGREWIWSPAVTTGSLCSPAKGHPASSSLLPQCLCTLDDELQLLPWSPHLCKNSARVSSP